MTTTDGCPKCGSEDCPPDGRNSDARHMGHAISLIGFALEKIEARELDGAKADLISARRILQ